MSNSPLVNFTRISPNSTNPRKKPITKITIHHVAGKASVETLGNIFASASRQASSNYGVGIDGRIGMYVEEKNRPWTSSSSANDNQAVTIEVANDEVGGNWHVSDLCLAKTIELCADICKRNNIAKLIYDGTPNGSLTRHNMFAPTACPGPYLQSKFPYIADEVNKQLAGTPTPAPVESKEDMIQYGQKNEQVRAYQNSLIVLGYTMPKYGADSSWGPETQDAHNKFQRDNKIPKSKVLDDATQAAILNNLRNKYTVTNGILTDTVTKLNAASKTIDVLNNKIKQAITNLQ